METLSRKDGAEVRLKGPGISEEDVQSIEQHTRIQGFYYMRGSCAWSNSILGNRHCCLRAVGWKCSPKGERYSTGDFGGKWRSTFWSGHGLSITLIAARTRVRFKEFRNGNCSRGAKTEGITKRRRCGTGGFWTRTRRWQDGRLMRRWRHPNKGCCLDRLGREGD